MNIVKTENTGYDITLVGMGASAATLTAEGAAALRRAVCIAGAQRLLDALPAEYPARRLPAVRPADMLDALLAAGGPAAALYSGDTGFYSGAAGLLDLLKQRGIPARVAPGLSSVQLLAAALGRPWQGWKLVSAHGAACDPVAAVCGGAPVFFLTGSGASGPAGLCGQLAAAGLADLPVTVGEELALPGQRITAGPAGEMAGRSFSPLSVLLAEPAPRLPARTPGWPDDAFTRADGVPMTKQAVRAQILAALAVRPGETVWDIGAGTGSVSLELAFANGGAPVWAIEHLPAACAVLQENRRRLGGWNLRVAEGEAPAALAGLDRPDAVFIGGSGGRLDAILDAVLAANPAARICLTAVALETVGAALAALTARGLTAQVSQIAAAHAGGENGSRRLHLLRAENPVFVITAAQQQKENGENG